MTQTGQRFQQAQQMLLVVEIQRGSGFVEKQPAARRSVTPQLRQRAGELDALLLAAGEGMITPAGQRQATGQLQHLTHNRRFRVTRPGRTPHANDLLHLPVKSRLRLLAHHCPIAGQRLRMPFIQRFSRQRTAAAVGFQVAGQQPQQRGFPRAVGADQCNQLSLRQ